MLPCSLTVFRLFFEVKAEVTPLHDMEAYSGSGGTAPLILDLGTSW